MPKPNHWNGRTDQQTDHLGRAEDNVELVDFVRDILEPNYEVVVAR